MSSSSSSSATESETAGDAAHYYFFTPLASTQTYLMDVDLNLVHLWESETNPGVGASLLPGGDLLRSGVVGAKFNFAGAGGLVERQTWEGEVLWTFVYSDAQHRQHHDIEPMPNGHVLMVAWELRPPMEAAAAGRNPATIDKLRGLWPDTIVELDPATQSVVWEWRVWDHLVQDFAPDLANYGDPGDHPELIDLNHVDPTFAMLADWNHVNGIDYHPGLDQIVISAHHFSELWIIDHGTTTAEAAGHVGGARGRGGDLLYRWGNPAAYRQGTPEDRRLFHQHDPRWVKDGIPGAGDLTIFNNGEIGARPYSTVEQITPPLADDGTYTMSGATFGPDTWTTYTADPPASFFSQIVGGVQRLASGDALVTEGDIGRAFEIDPSGTILWEYIHGAGVFHFDRVDADGPELAGRVLTPLGPVPGG
ncbi:MAG: aryl-sulfate sulfotransferase [Nannocystaceae bacterium]